MIGPAKPEHIAGFRAATGYAGTLLVDPERRSYRAAGLERGWARVLHPLVAWKGLRAFAQGFRQGARQGDPVQQGGTFVLGPGDRVRFEWRDRFPGDHPDPDQVVGALPSSPLPSGERVG